jgi:hypothetical protein
MSRTSDQHKDACQEYQHPAQLQPLCSCNTVDTQQVTIMSHTQPGGLALYEAAKNQKLLARRQMNSCGSSKRGSLFAFEPLLVAQQQPVAAAAAAPATAGTA